MNGKNRATSTLTAKPENAEIKNSGTQVERDGSKNINIIPSDEFTGKRTRSSQPIWRKTKEEIEKQVVKIITEDLQLSSHMKLVT